MAPRNDVKKIEVLSVFLNEEGKKRRKIVFFCSFFPKHEYEKKT